MNNVVFYVNEDRKEFFVVNDYSLDPRLNNFTAVSFMLGFTYKTVQDIIETLYYDYKQIPPFTY